MTTSFYQLGMITILLFGTCLALVKKRWLVFGVSLSMAVWLYIINNNGSYIVGFLAFIAILACFKIIDSAWIRRSLKKEAISKNYYNSPYYAQTHKDYVDTALNDSGSYGEFLVFDELKPLEEQGAKFIFNAYIPHKSGYTSEIDVIIITKSGLYVVESKNYSGWIFGDVDSKMWMQTLERGYKYRFYNPVWQNRTHCNYLKYYLKVNDSDIKSYIVFSDRCEFKKIPSNTEYYKILHRRDLLSFIKQDMELRKDRYPQSTVNNIYNTLFPLTQADDSIKQKHINEIRRIK